jgi:hypothetical protein
MSDNVISLPGLVRPTEEPAGPVVHADVVAKLEEFLQRARTGELVNIALAAATSDGAVIYALAATEEELVLLSALERARHLLNRVLDAGLADG